MKYIITIPDLDPAEGLTEIRDILEFEYGDGCTVEPYDDDSAPLSDETGSVTEQVDS